MRLNRPPAGLPRIVLGLWGVVLALIVAVTGLLTGVLGPKPGAVRPVADQAALYRGADRQSKIKSLPALEGLAPAVPPAALEPEPALAPTGTPKPEPTLPPIFEGPFEIGTSVEGRPLEVFRFGTGPEARMMVAGIHGGYEWNTTALVEALMEHLLAAPETIPAHLTLYVMPSLNPDGLARSKGYDGRANARGVDLNRNWPNDWAPDWSRDGCWDFLPITAGAAPVSEPETQALLAFLQSHSISALISYHSAGLGIFPGGLPPRQNSVDLAYDLAAVSDYPYPPVFTGCEITGNLVDWAAENGMAAVDLELLTHHDLDYQVNLEVLDAFLAWQKDLIQGR